MLPGQSTAASKNGCVMELTLTNFELHSSLCFCLLCLIWAAVAVKWCRSTRCRQSELAASHPHLQQRGGQEDALLISADEREKLGTGQDTKRILRAARARGDIFRLTVSWCPSLEQSRLSSHCRPLYESKFLTLIFLFQHVTRLWVKTPWKMCTMRNIHR